MANWIYSLLHGKMPGKGFLGRSSTGSGPGELLDPAAARALLEITPASHQDNFFPQWDGVDTGKLKEGFEAVEQWVTSAPTPTGTGLKGQRFYGSGYMYECVATNTWIRTAVEATW